MKKRIKKWLLAIVRLAVCVGALGWVLYNVTLHDYVTLADGNQARLIEILDDGASLRILDASGEERIVSRDAVTLGEDGGPAIQYGLKSTIRGADTWALVACLLVFAPVPLIQSYRFQLMLRAQDIEITYWESVKLSYAGNFLNFITALGSTGGDVFKMYYVSLHTDRKTEAVTTVFLDRIVGLFGLIVLLGIVLVVRFHDPQLAFLRLGVAGMLFGCVVGVAFLFSDRMRDLLKVSSILGKLPFGEHLKRAEAATRRLAHHKKLALAALGTTVVLQTIAITSFMLAAVALDMRSDADAIWDYYAFLPSGMVIAAVPISFQGLGTMEAFFKHTMLGSHGSLAAILCLAMTLRIVMLIWSLPGVIVTMTGSYRPNLSDEEVQFA